jgi:hypothetical protein
MRFAIACCFLFVVVLGAPNPVYAQKIDAEAESSWFAWSPDRFFGPCDGDCGIAVYGGREVMTNMTSVFLVREPTAPWNVQTGNAGVIAATMSRNFATLFGFVALGAEAGLDQRFGNMHAMTAWLALDLRLVHFPWDKVVVTTIGFAVGPDVAKQNRRPGANQFRQRRRVRSVELCVAHNHARASGSS